MTSTTPLDRAHALIDAAYVQLQSDPEFIRRDSQVELSRDVAEAFLTRKPLLAEAPTGTGKTIAYLIGALSAQQVIAGSTVQPVVVSTATKALQSQFFNKDLPALYRAGLLSSNDVAIAKGKGNYLCLTQADEVAELLNSQEALIDERYEQLPYETIVTMADSVRSRSWDGDFDNWKGLPNAQVIRPIAVSSDTCNNKKCNNYQECAFFRARNRLAGVRLIVANHDLLLRDFQLQVFEEAPGILPVSDFYVVFDEGHHLPEKAIAVGARDTSISGYIRHLPKFSGVQRILLGSPALTRVLGAHKVKQEDFDRKVLTEKLERLLEILQGYDVDVETYQKRFVKGVLPPDLEAAIKAVLVPLGEALAAFRGVVAAVRAVQPNLLEKPLEEKAVDIARRALDLSIHTKELEECLTFFTAPGRKAKWMFHKDEQLSVHCSPLEGGDILKPLLWDNDRTKGVAIVSATLRDVDGFERYKQSAGMPATTKTSVVPYSFPYFKSKIVIPAMEATPKMNERKFFLAELALKLPAAINPHEGTLVLFPSWAMLKEFVPKLRRQFGDAAVLVQGEASVTELRQSHSNRIDAKKGSILVGTSTLAEGLDLPGKLCEHVVIISLPFAVPTNPVEQELSDRLGKDYFSKRSLPDAMTRLLQMVGRLLRRETDVGRVTIFDRRLASTSYGRKMLEALPPFEKVIEQAA